MSTTESNGTQTAGSPPSRLKRWWPLIALVVVVAALIVGEFAFQRVKHRGWITYTKEDGLASNSISSIAVAPDGVMWVGTAVGVSSFDGETWTTYRAAASISAIAVAPDDAVWVAKKGGGVSRFDPLAEGEAWTTYTVDDGLRSNSASAIAIAPDGALWFATLVDGVSRFDPLAKGEAWTTYTEEDGLASNHVYAIAVAPDGALWFATAEWDRHGLGYGNPGVSRFDGKTWTRNAPAGLTSDHFGSIVVAPDGTVWVGTDLAGVFRFDPLAKGEAWTNYSSSDGLADISVADIAVAPDGAVWVGTKRGVSCFDGETWTTYESSYPEVASSRVDALAIDGQGQVWMGTPDGLCVLDQRQSLPTQQTLQVWSVVLLVLRILAVALLILSLVLSLIWMVRRRRKAREKALPLPKAIPATRYLAGAALGALLLGPIAGLGSACIVAPGFSMNTTGGGMAAWMAMVFLAPAGALIGAALGAFAVRRVHVLYLVGAVLGEVLFGIIGALAGDYVGAQLGEVYFGSAGQTHGALAGTVLGVIAGALIVYSRCRRLAKT